MIYISGWFCYFLISRDGRETGRLDNMRLLKTLICFLSSNSSFGTVIKGVSHLGFFL